MVAGVWFLCIYTAFVLARVAKKYCAQYAWYAGLIYLTMGVQLYCLYLGGLLHFTSALPLHLCSFSAVLSLPALMTKKPALCRFLNRLGRLGGVVALLFPAPLITTNALLSVSSFYFLHGLLVFLPIYSYNKERGRLGASMLAGALVFFAALVNALEGTNFLFLELVPTGTPFAPLNAIHPSLRAALLLMFFLAVLIPNGYPKRR